MATGAKKETPEEKAKREENELPVMIELDENINGEKYLDGQKPKAIKELWELGARNIANKEAHAKLTTALKEDKEDMLSLSRKYRQFFTASEDGTVFEYRVGGLILEVDREETETVKTRKDLSTPPPISAEQPPAGKGKKRTPKTGVLETF